MRNTFLKNGFLNISMMDSLSQSIRKKGGENWKRRRINDWILGRKLLADYKIYKQKSKQKYMYNTFLYLFILSLSGYLAYISKKPLRTKIIIFIVLYYIFFLFLEILDIFGGLRIWSQRERTSNCYDWFEHYFKKDYGNKHDFDYSESLFLNNYTLSGKEATLQKYNYMFKELNLGPGKKLLDCGSGICTWIDFCKSKGVDVIGLTLSEEQKEVCLKKKITAYVQDYRILDEKFIGKFDAISLLGSTEHITISSGYYSVRQNSYNDYSSLFNVLKQYLKPNGKMLLTVIVQCRQDWSVYDYMQAYFLERHYGGCYSTPEIISKSITDNNLKVVSVKDYTKDYHWISVVEPDHFGHWWVHWEEDTFDKITYFIRGLCTDPFLLHHWVYYGLDTWMWQFGGYQKTPLTDEQVKHAPANLKYFVISN